MRHAKRSHARVSAEPVSRWKPPFGWRNYRVPKLTLSRVPGAAPNVSDDSPHVLKPGCRSFPCLLRIALRADTVNVSAEVAADGDQVSGVRLDGRQVPVDAIVVVAGAWSRALGESLGFALLVFPQRGQFRICAYPAARRAVGRSLHVRSAPWYCSAAVKLVAPASLGEREPECGRRQRQPKGE